MLAPRSLAKLLAVAAGALVVALPALPALAQQSITPGATPEPAKEWTYYISWLVAPATVGLLLLIGLSYLRLAPRFFAKEEAPQPERRRPRYPTGVMAPPVSGGPRVDQTAAASTTPPAPPASEVQTAKEQEPRPTPAATPTPRTGAPAESTPERTPEGAAPAQRTTGTPPRDEPEPQEGAPEVDTQPAAVAPSAATTSAPAAETPGHVEHDQEVYERELQAQLDKGTDRRVAEGRAKAAAVRAARAKATGGGAATAAPAAAAPDQASSAGGEATREEGRLGSPTSEEPETKPKLDAPKEDGGGEPTPPPDEPPRIPAGAGQPTPEEQRPQAGKTEDEQKDEAEASAEAQAAVKDPERVIDAPTPAQDQAEAEQPPREVDAPAPEPAATAPEPADAERPTAPPGGDEETFNRVLDEQLGKGLARPIAESRARAAAIKAAREKSGG